MMIVSRVADRNEGGTPMASLMFRAKADNRFYSDAKKPNGQGTWYVFYYDLRGKKIRLRIGPNKRIAALAKGDVEARLAKQRGGLLDPDRELKRLSLDAFRERLSGFLNTENKSPKTISRYGGVFGQFHEFVKTNEPYLRYLDQVDAPLIERFKDHRRRSRITRNGHPNAPTLEGVSARTLNNELTYLHSVFNLAKRRGFVHKNPFEEVTKVNGQKRKHYEPLSRQQIANLLNAADDVFRPILLTLLLTGIRTGELLNLEWDDVDFDRDEIHIRAKEDWQPKDKEPRGIPLHSQLKPALQKLKKRSDSKYVFGKGEKPCPNKLLLRLHRTCRRAGVPPITVHNLRDEFASHLVMRGIGIETVSRLLGHSNIQVTWEHYIHLSPHRLKEAVETLRWETPAGDAAAVS
jgi:integrase